MTAILGISDNHDASAALIVDGEIVAAAQEERFTGRKMEEGLPVRAVEACLAQAGLDVSEIDQVAIGSENFSPVMCKVRRDVNFSVADRVYEQHAYWKPKLIEGRKVPYWDLFKDRDDFIYDDVYPVDHLLDMELSPEQRKEANEIRRATVGKVLGVADDRVHHVSHEGCHIYYGYYASPTREPALCLTCESFGDAYNSTVSTISTSDFRFLATSDRNDLGRLYSHMTLLLGMKPLHHEYKVMGLAPYANARETDKCYDIFKSLLKVEGLDIVRDRRPKDLYFHYRDALEGHRFDSIAGGLQKFTEEILCEWLRACLAETGLNRVIFSGGVAQNIKACMAMVQLDGVDEFHVSPASGDTSISVGACYLAAAEQATKAGANEIDLKPLDNIYLGPEFNNQAVAKVLKEQNVTTEFQVTEDIGPADIARLLADGKILGRCVGRMEFGVRALGNRSILADPRNPDTIRKINAAIKHRDFWMPFTPTILAERVADYIVNPKGLSSPYMTLAFDSTEQARREMIATLHPADMTMRPQMLERHRNPGYWEIIKEFEKLTGVGGLLNTSFNLHGNPIVLGPEEALFTLRNSELDGVVLGDFLVSRD